MIPPDWKSGYPDLPDAGASGHHVGMTKHLSFWLGMFCAALVAVPIAAGIMGAAEQELRRIAVMVFLFVAGLVLALVLALIFRDWILRKLFGRAEATLDDVSASLIAGVSAATAGDRAEATAMRRPWCSADGVVLVDQFLSMGDRDCDWAAFGLWRVHGHRAAVRAEPEAW